MRISTTQLYTESTRNMMDGQSKLADIQAKISSGKNFTTLADDPVAANQLVNLKRELAQFDVFATNIDATSNRLELEETTLDQISNAVIRSRELVIQAANGTLTDADRNAISFELEELVEYAASLMNTRDAKGEYIFSGSKGTTETYVKNTDGSYTYQGDDTRRQIQVGSTQYLESTDTGQFLFEAVPGLPQIDLLGGDLSPDLANVVSDYEITDPIRFDRYMQTTGDLSIAVYEGAGGNLYYSVRDSLGNPIYDTERNLLDQVPYDGTDPAQRTQTLELVGASLTLELPNTLATNNSAVQVAGDGIDFVDLISPVAPAANGAFVDFYLDDLTNPGPYTVTAARDSGGVLTYTIEDGNGSNLDLLDPAIFVLTAPGGAVADQLQIGGVGGLTFEFDQSNLANDESTSFTLALAEPEAVTLRLTQPQTNILSTLSDVTDALRNLSNSNANGKAELSERLELALGSLTFVQERLSQSVAGIGARLNTMDSARFSNEDFKLLTQETLSSIEDLDYASASTELAKRQLALEASYASFAKIQGLSLFNYIN